MTESLLATVADLSPASEKRSLIELHVVGRDLKRRDPLRLHVPQEVHEVAAVGLDRSLRRGARRRSRVRAPGPDSRPCRWRQRTPGRGRLRPFRPQPASRPSRKSLRSGRRGAGRGDASASGGGRAARSVVVSIARCPFLASLFGTFSPTISVRMAPPWFVDEAVPFSLDHRFFRGLSGTRDLFVRHCRLSGNAK